MSGINRLLAKYPDKIPIFVDVAKGSAIIIDKHKYLVPRDYTVSQFMYMIRKRTKLSHSSAIFIFCGKNMLCSQELMRDVYDKYKNKDGLLNMIVSEENTFG